MWVMGSTAVADSPAPSCSAPGLTAPTESSSSMLPVPVQNESRFPEACNGNVPNLSEENGIASTDAAKDGNEAVRSVAEHSKHPPHATCELWSLSSHVVHDSAPASLYMPGAQSSQLDPELAESVELHVPLGHRAQLT